VLQRSGSTAAVAPLYVDSGMAFFVGAGSSDYLDLVGTADAAELAGLLGAVLDAHPGLLGFRLHHVLDSSPTAGLLAAAGSRLGLRRVDEGSLPAPWMGLDEPTVEAATAKKSLRRHERWFRAHGAIEVQHLRRAGEVEPHLDAFFDQHVARWSGTDSPSLFADPRQRSFYRSMVRRGSDEGWLRFTVVRWDDRPVAHHCGSSHGGRYLWYKPAYDPELARRSPGEVLLRHLIREAWREGARVFDFGLGDEAFKRRFATAEERVTTWGLYS
jgi:CelD/BcsL family acetyltransferase involved in cellulose biosynthesis